MSTHLVQASTDIDGRGLNRAVDDLRERRQEIGRVNFRIEEDFRGEEALVTNVHRVLLRIGVNNWQSFRRDTVVRDPSRYARHRTARNTCRAPHRTF